MSDVESKMPVIGFADGTEARAARHDSMDGGGSAKHDARAEGWRVCGFADGNEARAARHGWRVCGFAAWGGTGKTTLLRQLIPWFKARGLRVAVIKATHHDFEIDRPGKDSYELRKAGAAQTLLVSPRRTALITEHENPAEPDLARALASLDAQHTDLVLVEGFKQVPFPKIELHRPALGKPLLYPQDRTIVAIATDAPLTEIPVIPVLDLAAPDEIGEFVLRCCGIGSR
jgi:molybdopterin-guanine dinucleotide biosynthesis protein B